MRTLHRPLTAFALLGLGLAACGEDDATSAEACRLADASEVYALAPQIAGASSGEYNTYLVLTDRLEGQDVSLDCSIELPGRALVVGHDGGGAVFVTSGDAPTLTRYDLVDGALRKGATLSFAAAGLSSFGEYAGQFVFASDSKAYFFDGATAQVVIFDPAEMAITGSLPLNDLVVPDAMLTFSQTPLVMGREVITFAGWRTSANIPSVAGIVVLDTETDQVHVAKDDRCGYVRDGVPAADGRIYMATEAIGAARHRINEETAPPPCMLRYDPATGAFDPEFYVELSTLFAGDAAGTLVRGPNDEAFLRVLDEDAVQIDETSNVRELASAPAWRWASVTLGDEPAVSILADQPATGGSVLRSNLGDLAVMPIITGTHTNLVELTPEGPGDLVLRVEGRLFSSVKVK